MQGMAPQLHAIALAPLFRHHEKQPDEAVGGVVSHSGDASHRLRPKPGHPYPLPVVLAVDGHVAKPRCEALLAGPVRHGGEVCWGQGVDRQ